MSASDDTRMLLARALSGEAGVWTTWPVDDVDALVGAAESHGVLPLLMDALPADAAWTGRWREASRDRMTRQIATDLVATRALAELLAAFDHAGIPVLMLKGVDLAHSVYARSDLRPRLDADLLVREPARPAAVAVLESLGYEPAASVGGDLLMYQQAHVLSRHGAPAHTVDLHWRVVNAQPFAAAFDFDDLWRVAEARPALGPAARGLPADRALLLACVHRVAHHYDDLRLIWLWDVNLLAGRLDADGWRRVVSLAEEKGVADACLRGLERVVDIWHAPVPPEVFDTLRRLVRASQGHAAYLEPGQRHVQRIWADLSALPRWSQRLRLVRQHVFPPARYMRDVYAPSSALPLPWLYARRVWRGARRWLVRV